MAECRRLRFIREELVMQNEFANERIEHDLLVMLDDIEKGLADAQAGRVKSEDEFRNTIRRIVRNENEPLTHSTAPHTAPLPAQRPLFSPASRQSASPAATDQNLPPY